MNIKILLAGEGGQGIQAVAKILAKSAAKSGKNVTYLPSFGVEQRGGVSLAFIQISEKSIAYPRFAKAQIVFAFCNRAIESIENYLDQNSTFVFDGSLIENTEIDRIRPQIRNYIAVPANQAAKEKFTSRSANMVVLGVIGSLLNNIEKNTIQEAIIDVFANKIARKPELRETNIGAFNMGYELAKNFDSSQTLKGIDKKEIKCIFQNEKTTWQRFPEYCKGCSLCIIRCPVKALSFSDDLNFLGQPMPIVDMEKCIGCGLCQNICPDAAIKVENK